MSKAAAEPVVTIRELDGENVHVVDGLFHPDVVRVVFEILKRLAFTLSDYDSDETAYLRHWKAEFEGGYHKSNPVLAMWHDAIVKKAQEAFPRRRLAIGRIHCNNHLYGDLQHTHTDIVPGVTALYFANPEWQEDWQGETVFYNRAGEPFHAVFIRAPLVTRAGEGVTVLARHEGVPVLLRQGPVTVASFHPELTADHRLHARFLQEVG